jgi:hypothetical protein
VKFALARALALCLAFLPAFFLGMLILQYSVDVPFADQWDIAPFFEKLAQGSLSFSDLFAQHNEYRQFFPNLIFVALGWMTYWNVRYEMLLSFLLACFVSFNVYRLGKLTINANQAQRLLLLFISNIFIFSPVQYENWLFGIQIIYFIPIFCITTCIVLAYSKVNTRTKFLTCMGLSTVSTFSSANGILCWIVVLPVLALSKSRDELIRKKWLIFTWIFGLILNIFFYLYNYQKPIHHPNLSEALVHPFHALVYFLAFLGGLRGSQKYQIFVLIASATLGTTLISLLTLSWFYLVRFSETCALSYRMLGWLMVSAYSVFTAIIVTFSRLGFGVEQALVSRYTTFSVYILISLIHIAAIFMIDSSPLKVFSRYRKVVSRLLFSTVLALALLHLLMFDVMIGPMSRARLERLQGKACLLFINLIKSECLTKKMYAKEERLEQSANALNNLGFLRPPLIKSLRMQDIEGINDRGSGDRGSFESLRRVGDSYVASGWASLPDRGEPADAILLAYDRGDGHAMMFRLVEGRTQHGMSRRGWRHEGYAYSHWQTSFALNTLPAPPIQLSAWAFDAYTGKAFKLNDAMVIQQFE